MQERIVIDPKIHSGKPIIRGTRVPVTRILGGLAGGMTTEEIMQEYEVSREDILAALNYATELLEEQPEDELMLSLFLNFLTKQALLNPDAELEAYTEAMAAEDEELMAGVELAD